MFSEARFERYFSVLTFNPMVGESLEASFIKQTCLLRVNVLYYEVVLFFQR